MTQSFFALLLPLAFIGSCKSDQPETQTSGEVSGIEPAFPNLAFNSATDLQHAGDGTNRLFVVEQAGRIIVFENSSSASTSKVFLDIRSRVNSGGSEEGLLGLAFHPDYASNGYFYVNYTASGPARTVNARFSVSQSDSDQADPNSELVLLEYNQPYSNHNGGQLSFGPDGYLYITTGDGGFGGDPHGNAQNLNTLLGKILRIDVDNPSGGRNYGIPTDNPFVGTGYREEIYAYGLRNVWRFSFDPATGWLWAADVGQVTFEEIDIIQKGKNYGWNIMEGSICFGGGNCDRTGLVLPVWEYGRTLGICVTGGFVYRGSRLPALVGAYVYADFTRGRIWSLRYDGVNPPVNAELMRTSLNISTFGVDQNNELYIVAYASSGKIHRFK